MLAKKFQDDPKRTVHWLFEANRCFNGKSPAEIIVALGEDGYEEVEVMIRSYKGFDYDTPENAVNAVRKAYRVGQSKFA
jgi:hypothetical protein